MLIPGTKRRGRRGRANEREALVNATNERDARPLAKNAKLRPRWMWARVLENGESEIGAGCCGCRREEGERRVDDGLGETRTGSAARVPASSEAQTFYVGGEETLQAAALWRNGVVELHRRKPAGSRSTGSAVFS
ncbi:hypothetical protein PIB30_057132 [Stylosanthes scabra]|uniref:Uncharacterized protein n=1 Tax=Stylosanthes scabra TaxID=79078 RepID=A0ABU6TJX5_9FABA|nr:hypothetical protein [Stylosanthes scabra]